MSMGDTIAETIEVPRDEFQALVQRVEQLEEELQQEREQSNTGVQWDSQDITDLWVVSSEGTRFPLGNFISTKNNEVRKLDDRVFNIERGEVDPGEIVAEQGGIDPEELLPIHQFYNSAKHLEPDEHGLSQNKEIAARLFPHIHKYSFPYEGRHQLPTPKVKEIIKTEIDSPELRKRLDVEDPNPNTAKRVMKFVAKYGGDIFGFDDSNKTNFIYYDQADWSEYSDRVGKLLKDGGNEPR